MFDASPSIFADVHLLELIIVSFVPSLLAGSHLTTYSAMVFLFPPKLGDQETSNESTLFSTPERFCGCPSTKIKIIVDYAVQYLLCLYFKFLRFHIAFLLTAKINYKPKKYF